MSHGFALLFWSLFASRLAFVLFHLPYFLPSAKTIPAFALSFLRIWDKGLSFWGGLTGFLIAFWFIMKKEGEPIKRWLDIIAESVLAGLALGTIGVFLDGIAHGRETSLPWGMIFQNVKYAVPIHPTQLYALIYILGILTAVKVLKRKKALGRPDEDGKIFELTVFLMSLFRFLEEFFRGDDVIMIFDAVRLPQIIALALFIAVLVRFISRTPKGRDFITQIRKKADFSKHLHSIGLAKKS